MRLLVSACVFVACGDDNVTPDAARIDAPIDASRDAPADAAIDVAADAHPALTEPYVYLPMMFAGAKAYWEQLPDGGSKQFPPTTAATPGSCCVFPEGACEPSPLYWSSFTWTALQFHIDGPSYFEYQFTSGGSDSTATFTARAYGDLNCDNILSTYEIRGSIDSDGGVVGTPITATNPNE